MQGFTGWTRVVRLSVVAQYAETRFSLYGGIAARWGALIGFSNNGKSLSALESPRTRCLRPSALTFGTPQKFPTAVLLLSGPPVSVKSHVTRRCFATRRQSDLIDDDEAKRDLHYQKAANMLLQQVCDQVEAAFEKSDILESVDLKDGEVLEITLARGKGVIVLNKHYIHRQIWYSAPTSGADYFSYAGTKRWTSARTQLTLYEQLTSDLRALTGLNVTLLASSVAFEGSEQDVQAV